MLKIAWAAGYAHPLPPGHRFPMEKYNLIPEQLLLEGTIEKTNLYEPGLASDHIIERIHSHEYFKKLKENALSSSEIRKIGFPFSNKLLLREIQIVEGTRQCALFALENGVSLNIAGGTHHAYRDRGEGFCILNDIAIAAQYLVDNKLARKILIIDLDVHQGNGTASIFLQRQDIYTLSIHGANNYPAKKEKSTWDIPLPDKTPDNIYLQTLKESLGRVIEDFSPDFIFYQSGVDILATDKLGKLSVTLQGCKERDKIVFQTAKENKIPIAGAMGGGYSEKISIIVEAHANTFRVAQEAYF